MLRLMDWLRTGALILAAIGGIVVSVFHIIGHPPFWTSEVPYLTLILIGLIALEMSLERFTSMRRIEKKLELIEGSEKLNDLPGKRRRVIQKTTQDYVNLQILKKKSKAFNKSFALLADEILAEQTSLLHGLSLGKVIVPGHQILAAHSKMAIQYKERFDAVSETDLAFWGAGSSAGEEYFKRNAEAVENGTAVTRIFILSISDLKDRFGDVVSVLERHQRAGIAWGVAISEEFEFEVAHSPLSLDCAIFDRDKAVSFFRKQGTNMFEAIFLPHKGHENEDTIARQRDLYKNLIVECWLVNQMFKEGYANAVTAAERREIEAKTARHNERLEATLGRSIVEGDEFVFVARTLDEVGAKVKQLHATILEWREAQGLQTR